MMMIRSQNRKTLCAAGEIYIEKCGDKNFGIFNFSATGRFTTLGKYDSETRCLKILDEIQDEFQYSNHFSGSGKNSPSCQDCNYGVYPMPEK